MRKMKADHSGDRSMGIQMEVYDPKLDACAEKLAVSIKL